MKFSQSHVVISPSGTVRLPQFSFSQLGNSAIAVKGKGLTNVEMYIGRKDF